MKGRDEGFSFTLLLLLVAMSVLLAEKGGSIL